MPRSSCKTSLLSALILLALAGLVGCAAEAPPQSTARNFSAVPGSGFRASSTSMGNAAPAGGFHVSSQNMGNMAPTGGFTVGTSQIGAPSTLQGFQPVGIPAGMVVPH